MGLQLGEQLEGLQPVCDFQFRHALGREAWRDNVFVERLWRSVKYERVYLKAYDGVRAARADIADYLNWYNEHRPHSRLERLTPTEKYLDALPPMTEAA